MKRTAVFIYLAVIHVALVGALLRPDLVDRYHVRFDLKPQGADHIETMRWYHKTVDKLVPDGATIFLGDSNTQAMPTFLVAPNAINFGIGSLRTDQLTEGLPNYSSLPRAKRIFLSIGTNDIRDGQGSALTERYKALFAELPRDVPLVWSSIIPRRPDDRGAIVEANAAAKALCASRPGCTFVDTWEFLAAPGGGRIDGLYLDNIHVNAKGHSLWTDNLRSVISAGE